MKGGKNERTLSVKTSWRRWCKRSVLKDEWDVAILKHEWDVTTWGDVKWNPRLERGKMKETSKHSLKLEEEVRGEERRWNEEKGRGDYGCDGLDVIPQSLDSTLREGGATGKFEAGVALRWFAIQTESLSEESRGRDFRGRQTDCIRGYPSKLPHGWFMVMADHQNHLRF